MSLVSNLGAHSLAYQHDMENAPDSQGPTTRTPTVYGHTIIGFQTLIDRQKVDPENPRVAVFDPPRPAQNVSAFSREEGDVVFTVDGDSEFNAPPDETLTTNAAYKPKFRTFLSGCREDAIINPVGFIPQYEAPAQQAGGLAGSIGNMTTTGRVNIRNRTRRAFAPGQKLMAAVPTAEIMTTHLDHREKRGEWRPIMVPVDNVIDEVADLDKLENPATAVHVEARRYASRAGLSRDAAEFTNLLSTLPADLRTRIRRCTKTILRKVATNVKAVNDAAVLMALQPIRENGTGSCQILQRV